MLSDVSTMVGGETAVLKGDASIQKVGSTYYAFVRYSQYQVRGPGIGNAVVLQGRQSVHSSRFVESR